MLWECASVAHLPMKACFSNNPKACWRENNNIRVVLLSVMIPVFCKTDRKIFHRMFVNHLFKCVLFSYLQFVCACVL
jgi:hypothetical protein